MTGALHLQVRNKGDDARVISADRDIAHNFKFVVMEVAKRLTVGQMWHVLNDIVIKPNNVTSDQLGETAQRFIQFVAGAADNPNESMYELMARSRFTECTPAAQIAYLAILGQVIAGIYFRGAKEATLGGIGPCTDIADLMAYGNQAMLLLSMSPRRRRWFQFKRKVAEKINGWLS